MATVTCPVIGCGYTASDDGKMHHHLVQHDPVAIQQNTCTICNVQAVNAERNRLHYIHAHNRYAKVTCPGCNTIFKYPSSLASHLRRCAVHLSISEMDDLVDKLPPVNEGDGVPDPSRFQRECVKRKRGNYKNTKTTREAGIAPPNKRRAPQQRDVRLVVVSTKRVVPRKILPAQPRPLEIKIFSRRFPRTRPVTPPAGLILVSEFNNRLRHQEEEENEDEDEEEGQEDADVEDFEETDRPLTFTYSHNMGYPLPIFTDFSEVLVPSVPLNDILPPPPPPTWPFDMLEQFC